VPLAVVVLYLLIDPKVSNKSLCIGWGIIIALGILLSNYFFLLLGYVYIHIAVQIVQAIAYPETIAGLLLIFTILYFTLICNALITILSHIFFYRRNIGLPI
jgi:predicted anti-sigma-YlaC factor YlaD